MYKNKQSIALKMKSYKRRECRSCNALSTIEESISEKCGIYSIVDLRYCEEIVDGLGLDFLIFFLKL